MQPQVHPPLPLPQTFPRTWTNLVNNIHCLPQALHRLSPVTPTTATVSPPIMSVYPAMNDFTPVTVASDTGTVATAPTHDPDAVLNTALHDIRMALYRITTSVSYEPETVHL